jgi:hypothetical protein
MASACMDPRLREDDECACARMTNAPRGNDVGGELPRVLTRC